MIEIKHDIDKIWMTSDTHFGHKNICRGVTDWRNPDGSIPVEQTRGFNTIDEMNEAIIKGFNDNIKQDDIIVHFGDWSFGGFDNIKKFFDRLICKNIHIIRGNHDEHIQNNKNGVRDLFLSFSKLETFKIGKTIIEACHFPIESWENMKRGVIHLHGHVHLPNHRKFGKGKRMDVGIDGHPEFRPYNFGNEILPLMGKRPVASEMVNDHHTDSTKNIVG